MTHRQFLAWQAWLRRDMNHPDRSDHYLMQLAALLAKVGDEVARAPLRVWGKDAPPLKVDVNAFRLIFTPPQPPKPPEPPRPRQPGDPPGPMTKEQVAKVRRAMREPMFGVGLSGEGGPRPHGRKKEPTPSPTPPLPPPSQSPTA